MKMIKKKEFRGILEPLTSIKGAVQVELFEDYEYQVTLNFKNINSFVNSLYSFLNNRYGNLDDVLMQIDVNNQNLMYIYTYAEFENGTGTSNTLEIHISDFEFDNSIEF